MAADLVYTAELNSDQILKSLKRIDASIDRIARDADKQFQGIGKSAGASGVQIGAISGIVTALTTEFINLGKQAIGALIGIAKESVSTALEFDTLRSRLLGIFDGSKPAAEEAFNFIQEKSKELGINLSELAGAFLPKVESLEQFERVAKIATALARSDPTGTGGPVGARIALQEAVTGQFTSLQKRFEFDDREIKKIKEAFADSGIDGFLTALEEVQAASGRGFGDFANTAQGAISRVNTQLEQLKAALGVPIVDELKEQFLALFSVMEGREDDLLLIADTFGRVVANIVDLIGSGLTDFLTNLDSEQVVEIGETIFAITEDVKLLGELLLGVEFPGSFIDGVDAAATKLHEVLETTAKILALSQAESARTKAQTQAAFDIQTESGIPFITSDDQRAKIAAAGQAAFDKSLTESVGAMQEATQATQENAAATDKRRAAIEAAKDTSTDDADALLGQARAAEEAAAAAEVLAGAQAKVDKAMAEAALDHARKLEDIDIAAERKRLDITIEFAQKREDAATDNLRKLADIQRKNVTERADAAKDLERKEQDIARKFSEERIDLEKDQRQKRVDVERDYRLKLQDIQRQFLLDADEAEQKRDAVAFLRAIKERDKQVQEAQITRQRDVDELKVNGELRKEELRAQQARELEEARLANERKIEDLRASLERAIEDQNIAYARQLADLTEGEARKNEEAARARERDIEDAKLAYDRKLADLQQSLADELAIIAAGNAAIEEEARRHAGAMAAAENSRTVRGNENVSSTRQGSINTQRQRATYASSRQGGINTRRQSGRAAGGPVWPGGSFPVGEDGPELFTPSANGRIIPNNQLLLPSFTPKSTISNITNSQQQNVNLGVLDPASVGVLNEAKMRNIVLNILAGFNV